MEVLIKPLSGCEYEIEFIVPEEEFRPRVDEAFKKLRSEITLPGFRRGRVPLSMIRQRFGKAVEAETIEEYANELFKQAMEERNIQPIGHPHMHDLQYNPGEPLSMRVHYETMPEVVAHDYKGIGLEHVTHEVTEEDIDREIDYLRQRERSLEEVQKADDEQFLFTVDLQMLDSTGLPVIGRKNEGAKINLMDEHVNRDLKAELLNMRSGEEKRVELVYEGKDGAEEREHVHVSVRKIERIILPEPDDDFARKVTREKETGIAGLREDIRRSLERHYEARGKNALEGQLVAEIIKRNPVDVPSTVVNRILESYLDQLRDQQPAKQLPADFDHAEFEKARRPDAIWQAKWMLLRQSIIEQEHLTVEDADVEERAAEQAEKTGIAKERLVQFLRDSEDMRNSILGEKAIALLLDHAVIRTVRDDDVDDQLISSLGAQE